MKEPKTEWESPLNAFEDALEHEKYITQSIYTLMDIAHEERDYMSSVFLNWFVTEQAEEESTVSAIIDKFNLVKGSKNGLFMIDRELSKRSATPAEDTQADN